MTTLAPTKRCPQCAEEIRPEAVRCKHCGADLSAHLPARPLLYSGSPKRSARLGAFTLCVLATTALAALAVVVTRWPKLGLDDTTSFFVWVGVIAAGALAMTIVELKRRAERVRVLSTAIEREQGVFNKRIDIFALRGVRDVRYAQSLWQRLLGIAVIEIAPMDGSMATRLVGLPRARELFETLRDQLEVARKQEIAPASPRPS